MGPRLSIILGTIVGYLEAFGYLDWLILGMNTATLWEQKALFKQFAT
jgi:hypothetical protein